MDRFHLRPGGRRARWARPAAVTLALAALAAGFALPARATPGQSGPASLAAARAEAARLQREVARLDLKVETLAEAHAGVQARLEGLIQASHRHQADPERSELALRATKAEYAGDVRDLYARGPLAPLELLLAAGDMHELALATGAAGAVLGRDLRALPSVGLAAGTVRARVQELGVNQAETLALRRRLAGQEAARRALVAAAAAWARTLPGWSASPTPTAGCRCPGPRASSGRPAAMSRWPTCAPATWCSSPTTRTGRPPSTTSACTSARA